MGLRARIGLTMLASVLWMAMVAAGARADGGVTAPHADDPWIRLRSIESRFVSYIHRDPVSTGNGLIEGRAVVDGRRQLSRGIDAIVRSDIVADNRKLSSGTPRQVHDRAARRPSVNVTEAYLEFRTDRFDARVGKQKIAWGKADGFNPTDVFAVFDYADLLTPDRMGVAGLRAFIYPAGGGVTIEAVVLPPYNPSRAGRFNTRWRPVLESGEVAVPVDVRFPNSSASNANYGLKVSCLSGSADLSFFHARVIDDVAGAERLGGVFVTPIFLKKRITGFDMSRVLRDGRWELHAEGAHTTTVSGLDDDMLQAVAGARRSFPNIRGDADLELTVEYAWEHVYSRRRDAHVVLVNRIQRPFPGSILIRAVWEWNEFLSWTVRGGYTARGADAYVVMNELAWRPTDLLELRAGFDALSGRGSRTTAAVYEENDRWRAGATIYFR